MQRYIFILICKKIFNFFCFCCLRSISQYDEQNKKPIYMSIFFVLCFALLCNQVFYTFVLLVLIGSPWIWFTFVSVYLCPADGIRLMVQLIMCSLSRPIDVNFWSWCEFLIDVNFWMWCEFFEQSPMNFCLPSASAYEFFKTKCKINLQN